MSKIFEKINGYDVYAYYQDRSMLRRILTINELKNIIYKTHE